jgi:Tetratricopeptide repeat
MTLASVYEQSARPQQAEQVYQRVITFVEQEFGADSPALKPPLDKLAAMMKSQGRLVEASQYEAGRNSLPESPTMR